MNNKGSTMVLLVIIIALIIILGTSVLSVAVKQYEIKRVSIESKQCFYMSERGLNEAYVKSCALIDESIGDALQLVENYLIINPLDLIGAKNIFIANYRIYIGTNIKDRIEFSANPSVAVWNDRPLMFDDNDMLRLILKSKYINENKVDRTTGVDLVISVPDYGDVADGAYDVRDYIEFQNWNS